MPLLSPVQVKRLQASANFARDQSKWSHDAATLKRRMRAIVRSSGKSSPMRVVFERGPVAPLFRFDSGGTCGIPLRISALRLFGSVQNHRGKLEPYTGPRYEARLDAWAHVRQYLRSYQFQQQLRNVKFDHVFDAIVSFMLEWDDASLVEFAKDSPEFGPLVEAIREQWSAENAQYIGSATVSLDRRQAWLETFEGVSALERARNDPNFCIWSVYAPARYDRDTHVMAPLSDADPIRYEYGECESSLSSQSSQSSSELRKPLTAQQLEELANRRLQQRMKLGTDSETIPQDTMTITIPVVRTSVKILDHLFKPPKKTETTVCRWSSHWTEKFERDARTIIRAVCLAAKRNRAGDDGLAEVTRMLKAEPLAENPTKKGAMPLVDDIWDQVHRERVYSSATPKFMPPAGTQSDPEYIGAETVTYIRDDDEDDGDNDADGVDDNAATNAETTDTPATIDAAAGASSDQPSPDTAERCLTFITGQTSCGKTTMLQEITRYGYQVRSRGDIGSFGGKSSYAATIAALHSAQQMILTRRNVIGDRSIIDNALWTFIMSELDPARHDDETGAADGDELFERARCFFDATFNEAAIAGYVAQKGLVLLDPETERNRERQMKRSTGGDIFRSRLTNYYTVQFAAYYMAARLFGWPILIVPYDEQGRFGSTTENLNFAINYFGPPGSDLDGMTHEYAKPTNEYQYDHDYAKWAGFYK